MFFRRRTHIAWAYLASMALPVSSAPSAVLNVPVAARVILFVQPAPVGVIPIGIIYQPGNAVSEADASDMERALLHGGTLGRVTFRSRRVPVTDLGQMSGVRAAFVTSGLRSYQADVAATASAQAVLTITSDTSCVSAGRCVVGITEGSKTQIVVSREAARRNHIQFGSAFLMLVKEI